MKRGLGAWAAVLATMVVAASAAGADDVAWTTDFAKAKESAQKAGRPILAAFMGSDWCGWCIKLDKEVFSQKAFTDYARDAVIAFQADFPMQKKLPEALVKQNKDLAETYGVQGFPTVLLLDSKGQVVARTGYRPGGAASYVEHLKGLTAAPPAPKNSP